MTRLCIFALIVLVAGCERSPQREEVARLEKEIQKQVEIGLTQYGIKCYLETSIPGCEPTTIDGRYVAHAYIPSRMVAGMEGGDSPIVAIGQFLCTGPKGAEREKKRGASGPFPEHWYDASTGLSAIQPILEKFRDKSVKIFLPDSPPDLRDGVIRDLENIERVLKAADKQHIRFYLALDI
jgi:hypothetical protein